VVVTNNHFYRNQLNTVHVHTENNLTSGDYNMDGYPDAAMVVEITHDNDKYVLH
jgi:hypothetical protein